MKQIKIKIRGIWKCIDNNNNNNTAEWRGMAPVPQTGEG